MSRGLMGSFGTWGEQNRPGGNDPNGSESVQPLRFSTIVGRGWAGVAGRGADGTLPLF